MTFGHIADITNDWGKYLGKGRIDMLADIVITFRTANVAGFIQPTQRVLNNMLATAGCNFFITINTIFSSHSTYTIVQKTTLSTFANIFPLARAEYLRYGIVIAQVRDFVFKRKGILNVL